MFAAATLTIPARIFPIYFPMGNLATGFFIILSLLAGVVGFTCSITGLNNVFLWNAPNLHAAYASALASLSLTLLALGLMLILSHSVFTWNLPFLLSNSLRLSIISCWCIQIYQALIFSMCAADSHAKRST